MEYCGIEYCRMEYCEMEYCGMDLPTKLSSTGRNTRPCRAPHTSMHMYILK